MRTTVARRLRFRPALTLSGVVLATAFAASRGATAAEPTPKPDLVFLLAGQSNMAGHGQGAELPGEYLKIPANVRIYEAGKLRPVTPRQSKQTPDGGSFGPELSFGFELARAMGVVRAAFVDTERNVPHVRIVSTVDLDVGRDGLHYDTAGQLEFGKRFARAWLEDRKAVEKNR